MNIIRTSLVLTWVSLLSACGKSAPEPEPISTRAPAPSGAERPPTRPPAPAPEAAPAPPADVLVEVPPCEQHQIAKPLAYRDNSVKGDFRVMRVADGGFVASWRDVVVGRGPDRAERWRLDDLGRWVAPSPDGKRLAVLGQREQKVAIVDAVSGRVEKQAPRTTWSSYIAWSGDGERLLVDNDKHLEVLDLELKVITKSQDLPDDGPYVGFFRSVPGDKSKFWVVNPNAQRIHVLDSLTATFGQPIVLADFTNPEEIVATADGKRVFLTGDNTLHRLDASLHITTTREKLGCGGLSAPDAGGGEPHQYHWMMVAEPSPDGKRILANDASGQLFVLESEGLGVTKIVPRTLADRVDASTWVDDSQVAVLTNDGRFEVLDLAGSKVVFSAQDLEPLTP